MSSRSNGLKALVAGYPAMPPNQALHRIIYWSVLIFLSILAGFTTWHLERIPAELETEARVVLSDQPSLLPLLSSRGRDLILQGEWEPYPGSEEVLTRLNHITGVRAIKNGLVPVSRPTPRFNLDWPGDQPALHGQLNGETLDRLLSHIRDVFPDTGIEDRIQIDDRLSTPLWLEQLPSMLTSLLSLDSFSLHGTRLHLRVEGTADTATRVKEVHRRVQGSLHPAVTLSFRVRPAPDNGVTTLSLTSDLQGTRAILHLNDQETAARLRKAIQDSSAFGKDATVYLKTDSASHQPKWIEQVDRLMPLFGLVSNLTLISGGQGLWLWGHVPDERTRDRIHDVLEENGLGETVISHLVADTIGEPAEISIFRDRKGAVLTGRLPGTASKSLLRDMLQDELRISSIEDHITIDPGTFFSPWGVRWSKLSAVLPKAPIGLTISDGSVLITGHIPSKADRDNLILTLQLMFDEIDVVDWLTVNSED